MHEMYSYSNNVFSLLNQIPYVDDDSREKIEKELISVLSSEYSTDLNEMISRIREIGCNIRLAGITERLLKSLTESIFCYINCKYIATISTIGVTAELFCVHLYEDYLNSKATDRPVLKQDVNKFSKFTQEERIDELHKLKQIDDTTRWLLNKIRGIRNDNVHPSNKSPECKEEALDCIQNMVDIINSYSDRVVLNQIRVLLAEKMNEMVFGSQHAKKTLIFYGDYQCPFTKRFWADIYPSLKKEFIDSNQLKLIFRHFPLDFHKLSLNFSIVVEMVKKNDLKKALNLHENILLQSVENEKKFLNEICQSYNLDLKKALMTKRRIEDGIKEAKLMDITGTPHFFIGDIQIPGFRDYETFQTIINNF